MNSRLVGLTALAAILAGYVAYEGLGFSGSTGGGDAPPAAMAPGRTGTVKLNPLEGLDPKSFSAIAERPLFNPTRQPRPAETDAPPPPPPPEPRAVEEPPPPAAQGPGPADYKLLGVSAGPDGRIAALRVAASGDVVYLRKGESIDNWTVIDVGDRTVAIGTEESPVTFSLFENVDAAPGGQPDMTGDGAMPPLQQPALPLPVPMPAPAQRPGEPPIPEQHTVPEGTSG